MPSRSLPYPKVVQGESRAKEDAKHFLFAMPSRSLPYLKVVQGERRRKEKVGCHPTSSRATLLRYPLFLSSTYFPSLAPKEQRDARHACGRGQTEARGRWLRELINGGRASTARPPTLLIVVIIVLPRPHNFTAHGRGSAKCRSVLTPAEAGTLMCCGSEPTPATVAGCGSREHQRWRSLYLSI